MKFRLIFVLIDVFLFALLECVMHFVEDYGVEYSESEADSVESSDSKHNGRVPQ